LYIAAGTLSHQTNPLLKGLQLCGAFVEQGLANGWCGRWSGYERTADAATTARTQQKDTRKQPTQDDQIFLSPQRLSLSVFFHMDILTMLMGIFSPGPEYIFCYFYLLLSL
jgi:hypothetical protein